jgi:hypothetical protein
MGLANPKIRERRMEILSNNLNIFLGKEMDRDSALF